MLDENRIKLMTKLASYEEEEGKKALIITKYFRSDYVGFHMIKTAISISISYCLMVAIWLIYKWDYLIDHINNIDLVVLGRKLVIQYLGLLVVYVVIAYILYSIRYLKASQSVREYNKNLRRLEKYYQQEKKKPKGSALGGKHDD